MFIVEVHTNTHGANANITITTNKGNLKLAVKNYGLNEG